MGEVDGLGSEEGGFGFSGGKFGEFVGDEFGVFIEEDGADGGKGFAMDFGMGEGPGEGFVRGVGGPFGEVLAEVVIVAGAILEGEVEGFGGVALEEAGDDSAEGGDVIFPEVFLEKGDGEIWIGGADGMEDFGVEFGVFGIGQGKGLLGVVTGEGPPVEVLEF